MKRYPTIPKDINRSIDVYAFDKLDGSNIRAEWTRKAKVFSKFGTRKRLLDKNEKPLGEACNLIIEKYQADLTKIFVKERWEKVICFFEFFGENSFAGNHEDEPHNVILFDVNPHKKGILRPKEFLSKFAHLDIPELLYHGKANREFQEQVTSATLPGMTFEGVVCKSNIKHNPITFKIKNARWIKKLKEMYKGNDALIEELL